MSVFSITHYRRISKYIKDCICLWKMAGYENAALYHN